MEQTFVTSKRISGSSPSPKSAEKSLGDDATIGSSIGYKSSIAPRNLIIQRNSYSGNLTSSTSPNSSSLARQKISGAHYGVVTSVNVPSISSFALISSTGVNAVKQSSSKEKRDMQDLNERLASYIDKVRFLEAQNKKLSDELEKLKAKWGKETSQIKAMYQEELDQARKLMEDATRGKAKLELHISSLREEFSEISQKYLEANQMIEMKKDLTEKQNRQLADYEAELNLLRKRLEGVEADRARDKRTLASLQESLNKTRVALDDETLRYIDSENRRQTLHEEVEFMKTIHEQEMKELTALAYKDSTAENREYWKTEMGQALREIQLMYDEKLTAMKNEMEGYYNLKVQELKTGATRHSIETSHSKEETKRLRTQFNELKDRFTDLEAKNSQLQRDLESARRESDLREKELTDDNDCLKVDLSKMKAEMESMLFELQNILDAKLGLELEIAAYRKLLEGEESRSSLKNIVDSYCSVYGGNDSNSPGGSAHSAVGGSAYEAFPSSYQGYSAGSPSSAGKSVTELRGSGSENAVSPARPSPLLKGELSARTTYQKTAKGAVSISECSTDGRYLVVENTGRKAENIGGWKIVRLADGRNAVEFAFKEGFMLDATSKIKVWSHGCKPESGAEKDLVCDGARWDVGANVATRLFNTAGEERATHLQITTYV